RWSAAQKREMPRAPLRPLPPAGRNTCAIRRSWALSSWLMSLSREEAIMATRRPACVLHGASLQGAPISRPLHKRRQRRQDGFHIAAGLEAEGGASIVQQVELDIAAATHELLLALRIRP